MNDVGKLSKELMKELGEKTKVEVRVKIDIEQLIVVEVVLEPSIIDYLNRIMVTALSDI